MRAARGRSLLLRPGQANPLVGLNFDHPLEPTCTPAPPRFGVRSRRLRPRAPASGIRLDALTSPQSAASAGCRRVEGRKKQFGAGATGPVDFVRFINRRRSGSLSHVGMGPRFGGEDQAPPITLYPVGAYWPDHNPAYTRVARPGMDWTNLPVGLSPRDACGHKSHPGRGERSKTAARFGFTRASTRLLQARHQSRDSARGRLPACAPGRRWQCASPGLSGPRRAA